MSSLYNSVPSSGVAPPRVGEPLEQWVSVRNVSKSYRLDAVQVPALVDINVEIHPNRFTVLCGPSGSGKTTLLNMIGCIDQCDCGEIVIAGRSVQSLSDVELTNFRARHLGFIFQTFNLIPVLSARENVEYPLHWTGMAVSDRRQRVDALLEAVGLADKGHHRPGELSGGQRQRVAIARALVTSPTLVLADEPTANLDSATGAQIIALMRRMQREHAVSFVFSSHDAQLLAEADDVVHIRDGRITRIERLQERRDGSESALSGV